VAKIKIMDANLANKIAAGEVIERPSSVVKELVENAIDAGATKIDVLIEEAGLQSIKIIDNGSGMDPEDARNAFGRHATSKLLDESDLFRISTLGFRGEALPSIASVSDVILQTSTGDEAGTYVHIRGGKVMEERLASARKGTEMTVSQIFFNTPARLKYLKALNTELGYTVDFINKIALSHAHIAFRFVSDGKTLLQTNGNGQILNIISSIYGLEVAKKMKEASYKDQLMTITCHFSEPEVYRTSRHYINLVVNNRVVKNADMVKAIIDGYEGYLPINRYPIVVIDIEIDPLLIDVNVHPAKLEIRFSNNDHIKSVITNLVRSKLKEMLYIPKVSFKEFAERRDEPKEDQQSFDFKENPFEKPEDKKETEPVKLSDEESQPSLNFNNQEAYNVTFQEDNQKSEIIVEEKKVDYDDIIPQATKEPIQDELKVVLPKLYYIGQLSGTYLLAQNDCGLYMIDQHAAEERINYEYYLAKLSQDNKEIYELLVPETFEFSLNEAMIIERHLDQFEKLHIKIEKFGMKSFIVTEIPNWFKKNSERANLEVIFETILNEKQVSNHRLFNDLAATLACKRSIKANHYINEREVQTLLDQLVNCQDPYRCPHGRPVVIHLSFSEIEYLFKRTV
jgi:DNA mismatch repair protein MutL